MNIPHKLTLTRCQVIFKEAKGPISFCAHVADMCVPSQIVNNGYAETLAFLYIIEDHFL